MRFDNKKLLFFLSLLLLSATTFAATLTPAPNANETGEVPEYPSAEGLKPEPVKPEVKAKAPKAPTFPVRPQVKSTVSTELRPVSKEKVLQTAKAVEEEGIDFNAFGNDCYNVIKQISRLTGKSFLLKDNIKNCSVTIITERKITKDELWEIFLSALESSGYTVIKGPAGLYKLVPIKAAQKSPLPMYFGESPFTDAIITRLVALENINASDMEAAVKSMISSNGNMFSYDATNTLIITDTGTNIERIVRLIKELDRTGPSEVMEIIPLIYAAADDIAQKIQALFDEDDAVSKRRSSRRKKTTSDQDIAKISKILPDERTNSLIVLASKSAIRKIKQIIAKLDSPLGEASGQVHVHRLKHANSEDLSATLSSLTQAASKSKSGKVKGAASTALGFELGGDVNITADKNTNSLIILASPKDYETLVERVISKLDIQRSQVYVEAIIMELVLDKEQSLGLAGSTGIPFGLAGNGMIGFGSMFGGSSSGSATGLASGGVTGGAVSTDTVSVNITGADGSATTITVPKFFAAITAQASDIDVNVLSTPNLLTLDNETATIVVAQKEPFRSGEAVGSGGVTTSSFTREDVGLTLEITPQINDGNSVLMKIRQEKSDVLNASGPLTAVAGASTKKRSVDTTVIAQDGQTIVIGGLLEDALRTQVNKVPFLGDIPILGWLFKNRTKKKVKSNMLVFITPHVIRDVGDFNKILRRKLEERNTFIDRNYGKRQRTHIRKSIKEHADSLLEYEGQNKTDNDVSKLSKPVLDENPDQPIKKKRSPKKRKKGSRK